MASMPAGPQTWTLRLKHRKTTVLLHTNPLHTFTTIKTNLYAAIQETPLTDPETGLPIPPPSSPSDIQFGRPANINDPHGGFVLGEWEYPAEEELEETKGKGKGRPRKSDADLAGVGNVKDCPKGAGLRDNAVLAFRWAEDGTGRGGREEVDALVAGEKGLKADMWGVRIPTFEDAYGVQNTGDVGGGSEFEG